MKKIIIINGPNLNLLGKRQPEIYGSQTFDSYYLSMVGEYHTVADITYYQTNHEGQIIDKLHEVGFSLDGIILNAGGYTHTSIAIRDAVSSISTPVIEVHISDIHAREPFRRHSYLTDVCHHHFIGHGLDGYKMAVDFMLAETNETNS